MAVQPQTPFKEYTANGTTTVFPLDFDCENKDHLIVMIDDAETDNSTWTLNNKQVMFNAAPAAGKKITVQRNTPFGRNVDYQSYNNSFRPPAVNKDFDWIWWKLQELGVADWILGNRINALKNYVDDRDDELRAYLMEEIRKQGVALDQLDEYYNYLMQRLAQIAVDKGWDASFVVDGDKTQKQINDSITSLYNPLNLNYTQQQLATAFTASLNSLIQKVSLSGGGTISVPDGVFLVDVSAGITMLNNVELRLGKNTRLKALAHNMANYQMIRIHDVKNVSVSGGVLDGNKSQNSATSGEWGMGISIRGSDKVKISNLDVKNTWGDGYYIGRTENRAFSSRIELENVTSDGARRNGLSVVSVKELDVNNSSFDNSFETEPKCGVDIEPNYADEFIQGVRFKDLKTSGNNIGFNVFLKQLEGTSSLITVTIDGYTDKNSKRENFANRNYLPDSRGYVSLTDYVAINDEQASGSMLALYSIAKTGLKFKLKNISLQSKITDVSNTYIRIGSFDSAKTNEVMGGIDVDGLNATSLNGTLPTNAVIVSALATTSKVDGVNIRNITKLDAVNPIRSANRVSNLQLSSDSDNFFISLASGIYSITPSNLYPLYRKDSDVVSTVALPNNLPSGFEFELRNEATGNLNINIADVTLVSEFRGSGSLRTSVVGGFIKFKSLGGGIVKCVEHYGFTQDGATASIAQSNISIPANSQVLLKNITLTGITTSDAVAVSYSTPTEGLKIWAACEVNGSVNVYAVNHTASAISLTAGTIKVNRL